MSRYERIEGGVRCERRSTETRKLIAAATSNLAVGWAKDNVRGPGRTPVWKLRGPGSAAHLRLQHGRRKEDAA